MKALWILFAEVTPSFKPALGRQSKIFENSMSNLNKKGLTV